MTLRGIREFFHKQLHSEVSGFQEMEELGMTRIVAWLCIAIVVAMGSARGDVAAWLDTAAVPMEVTAGQVREFLMARVPPLTVPETREAWGAEAQRLRREFLEKVVLEGVPESWTSPETAVVWGDMIDKGAYRIRKLRYEALPGLWIPAALYEPAEDVQRVPAVLNVNGHVGPPGKAFPEEQIRCINLARRGMLALHPEWFSFGELGNPEYGHSNLAYLDLVGVRGVSVFYLALKRALDVLAMDPRTDQDRIAMTGLSGGGWQTAFLSSLDERIDLIVPVAGHGAMKPRIEDVGDLGDLEQVPSDMLTVADYTHLTALFAPRPTLLIYNAKDNCCFLPEVTLPALYDVVMPVYSLFGAEVMFEKYVNEDPGTHNYALDNRQQFYRFLNKHFLPPDARVDAEIPSEEELLQPEELYVGIPEDNATFVSLAKAELAGIERADIPNAAADFDGWQEARRVILAEVARPVTMTFRAVEQSETEDGDARATTYRLKSDDWTIPAVYIVPAGADKTRLTVVVADAGMASMRDTIVDLLARKRQVVAVDPTFMGRNLPHESQSDRLAMAVNATGDRLLGIQAGQIAAVCKLARRELSPQTLEILTQGANAGLAALVAVGMTPGTADRITLLDMPERIGQLIAEQGAYKRFPAVFCFGLLKAFDVPELVALCQPAVVERVEVID